MIETPWKHEFRGKIGQKMLIAGTIFLVFGLAWIGESATANVPTVRYQILPKESSVSFQADSTFGAFSGSTDQVSGEITSTSTAWEQEVFPPVEATVIIDVRTLDTGIRLRNKDMQGVMEVERYPQIIYHLETAKQTARYPDEGRFVYDTVGKLQIHGMTRTIYMVVEVKLQGAEIRITGETSLRMSGYGITPPSRFLFIRVQDTVTIQFQLVGRQTGR